MSTVIDVLHSVLYFVQLVATVLVDENLLEELYELSVMGGLGGAQKKTTTTQICQPNLFSVVIANHAAKIRFPFNILNNH